VSLAEQIINHQPWQADALCGFSSTGEEMNELREALVELRRLRAAAEELKRFQVDVVHSPPELYATLECGSCTYIAELEAPADLDELVQRAGEHTEVCQ